MAFRNFLPLFRSSLRVGTQSARKLFANVSSNIFRAPPVSGFSLSVAAGLGLGSSVTFCSAPKVNWDQVKKDVKAILEEDNYDDGHIGPLLVRLAWHASGTYDAKSKTGGSDGATMRFQPEAGHGANAGLIEARKRLEKIAAKHPGISVSDLWIFASYIAIEDMGGPHITFSPGRQDKPNGEHCPPNGRLPDADGRPGEGPITKPTTIAHIRDIFYRMGFNDQEIVALLGAHALGRCHTGLFPPPSAYRAGNARRCAAWLTALRADRSGYVGPWTRAPTTFSNEYFRLLLESKWVPKKWKGPLQYENTDGGDLMMLPTDLALVDDPSFRSYVELYTRDEKRFFADFARAFKKLTELGCQHIPPPKPWYSFF
jgi:cytochrome c peroxidase